MVCDFKVKIYNAAAIDFPSLTELYAEVDCFFANLGLEDFQLQHKRSLANRVKQHAFIKKAIKEYEIILIAITDNLPVGFLMAKILKREIGLWIIRQYLANTIKYILGFFLKRKKSKQHHCGLLSLCYVKPNYRQSGIGNKLVEECLKQFKTKGITTVNVNVHGSNELAKEFWLKRGFTIGAFSMTKTLT
ncbi:MAG: GNAT family N-acetyltransferase [Candidatus Saganbacteria bacterium]|nr:GNAT family N-acetyltransferase [Candidatus Saganbacteria bacterium]